MSYMALYRKYRPMSFQDVKGQDHIVQTLQNQIKSGRIGHAYLFCGTRGTGKTTIAKIFARAVNCEHPTEFGPCNECTACQSINQQTSMNVIEMDAASNNRVDDVRQVIDEVQYSPAEGKYKVYIIDEVHMLTTNAFNALLKTLEEPPAYLIFILATTEVHKIPLTILSRCQRYDFKRISVDEIAGNLKELMDKEGVETEEKALRYIAKAADGSMRDSLSLLEQCVSFYFGEKLTYENVLGILGAVDTDTFHTLLSSIINGNVNGCLHLLEEMITYGKDLTQFVSEFVWYLRDLLLLKTSSDAGEIIEMSEENIKEMEKAGKQIEVEMILRYIRILSDVSNQLKYATQKRVLLEITLIKLCKPEMEQDYDSLSSRIHNLEKKLEQGSFTVSAPAAGQVTQSRTEEKETKAAQVILPKAVSEELKEVAKNWNAIVGKLSPAEKAVIQSATPSVGEGNTLLLLFNDEVSELFFKQNEEKLAGIESIIQKMIKKEVKVATRYIENKDEFGAMPDLTKIIKMDIEYIDE